MEKSDVNSIGFFKYKQHYFLEMEVTIPTTLVGLIALVLKFTGKEN